MEDTKTVNRIFYLAGGDGSRFGENKLRYPLLAGGECKPMYRHALDRMLAIVAERNDYELYVVTCHPDIYSYVKELEQEQPRVHAVDSPDSPLGLSYTIRAGLAAAGEALPEIYDTFLVADMPYVSRESLADFMGAVIESGRMVGCMAENGRFKNPVMFQVKLEPELLELTGDNGGKSVFLRHKEDAYVYETTGELADLDYKEDISWEKVRQLSGKRS